MLRYTARRACAAAAAATTATATEVSDAQRLKVYCTRALHKYKDPPAEVFVHRGEAYLELEQPYFALSDFMTAAEKIPLGKAHNARCEQAIECLPEEQELSFPATDVFLDRLVEPFVANGFEVASTKTGRGIIATAPATPGTVVIRKSAQAWMTYPLQDKTCSFCAKPLGVRAFPCRNEDCHEEYCSRECRKSAGQLYHEAVCSNKYFQGLELEVYGRHQSAATATEKNVAALHLLLLRLLAASASQTVIPSAVPEIQTLSGRIVFSPLQLATTQLDFYKQTVRVLQKMASISYEQFVCCLAKISANAFQTENEIHLNIPRSLLNHSCASNAAVVDGAVVTTKAIKTGDQVCLNYYPALTTLPTAERKAELHKRSFDCACNKCVPK